MDKKKGLLMIIALVLVVVLVLVLCITSCEEEQESKLQIGLCLRQYEEDPRYGQLLQTRLSELGYEVQLQDAKNDQIRQTEQIDALLEEGVVLMVIEPVIQDTAEATAALLMEKNVPAVFLGSCPETALEKWDRLSFVGTAEDQLGQMQSKIVLQAPNGGDLNEDGQISCLVISGPEDDISAKAQAEDCLDALVQEGLIVDRIDTSWGEWTQDSGRARCAKALSQYGRDIEVIFCGNEEITLGALEAVQAGGWQIGRDYLLVGVGAEEKLSAGAITGTVVSDPEGVAQQVLTVAQSLINGEPVEKEYYVNHKLLTPEKSEL